MVTIPAQFNGPVGSGNGGYVCGLLATEHRLRTESDGPVTVSLRMPPPLDAPLTWEQGDDELRLLTAGGAVVGEAAPGAFERAPAAPVSPTDATAAADRYHGLSHHPFSRCFTCGTDRAEGDGLRLFSGPVDGRADTVAAPWTPHLAFLVDGEVPRPIVWAAIDCPGGWAADFSQHVFVLGRMTGEVVRVPRIGEECVVVGHLEARDGRKFFTDTTLHDADGTVLARSEQLWITVDPAVFGVSAGG